MEFKHPNYYKNLRKLYRLRDRNQAISDNDSTESKARAPGPGLKVPSSKHQAASVKPQATSVKLQATSVKLQDS